MAHRFVDLIDLKFEERRPGYSRCTLAVQDKHLNPNGVAHGAVAFALADTGMGAALFLTLSPGENCATIEIKISYFKPVVSGALSCVTEVVNRGRKVASMESSVFAGDALVAKASGTYAIFRPRGSESAGGHA